MADVRYSDLIRKLAERGWQVVHGQQDNAWWANEIWTVESVWAPAGFTVFVTWLIDPQDEKTVWGVGASLERPTDRLNASTAVCISVKRWPRDVPDFLATLDKLRDAAST